MAGSESDNTDDGTSSDPSQPSEPESLLDEGGTPSEELPGDSSDGPNSHSLNSEPEDGWGAAEEAVGLDSAPEGGPEDDRVLPQSSTSEGWETDRGYQDAGVFEEVDVSGSEGHAGQQEEGLPAEAAGGEFSGSDHSLPSDLNEFDEDADEEDAFEDEDEEFDGDDDWDWPEILDGEAMYGAEEWAAFLEEEGALEFDGDFSDGDEDFSGSEASSVEPAMEREACERIAELTAGRFFATPPAYYNLPSIASHFQSADALALCPDPLNPGALLIATVDAGSKILFRAPASGTVSHLGGPAAPLEFLGAFQSPSQEAAYSLEMASTGRLLVGGTGEGILEIYAVNPGAPQRPPVPALVELNTSRDVPFLYLPFIPPDSGWVAGEMKPRSLNDARYMEATFFANIDNLSAPADAVMHAIHPLGANMKERVGTGWGPIDSAYCYNMDSRFFSAKALFDKFADSIGGKDKINWRKAEEADAGGASTSAAAAAAADQGAVVGAVALGGILSFGFDIDGDFDHFPVNVEGMVNGVRFGLVGGKERLLAAEQSGQVFVFEVPPPDCPLEEVAQRMMCAGLGDAPSPHWSMQPVNAFRTRPTALGVAMPRRGVRLLTAALGRFDTPCNLAVPSPDGRWIAVVGDSKVVHLLDQHNDFAPRHLPFEPRQLDYDFLDIDVDVGAQYCAWNRSSSLLAVTSDVLHTAFVLAVPSGEVMMRVEGCINSVLPCQFAPWSDNVLVFAEEAKHVNVRVVDPTTQVDENFREDLAEPGPSSQLLRIPALDPPPKLPPFPRQRRRITGMAHDPDSGDVWVSTGQGIVFRYLSARPFALEETRHWPPAFRKTVQTLLLCANRRESSLAVVPTPVLFKVVRILAERKCGWTTKAGRSTP